MNVEKCLAALSEKSSNTELTGDEQIEQEAFKEEFIPKCLTEVKHYEQDINNIKSGEVNNLIYQSIVGLKSDLSGVAVKPEMLENEESDNDGTSSPDEKKNVEEKKSFVSSARPKHETLDEKKERKKAVKQAQAEKHFQKKYIGRKSGNVVAGNTAVC